MAAMLACSDAQFVDISQSQEPEQASTKARNSDNTVSKSQHPAEHQAGNSDNALVTLSSSQPPLPDSTLSPQSAEPSPVTSHPDIPLDQTTEHPPPPRDSPAPLREFDEVVEIMDSKTCSTDLTGDIHCEEETSDTGEVLPEASNEPEIIAIEPVFNDSDLSWDSFHRHQKEMFFPLYSKPLQDFTSGGLGFGAYREPGRRHAANDLLDYPGSAVHAVTDGKIINYDWFYEGTREVVIDHGHFIIRYGEIDYFWDESIRVGSYVHAGQKIAGVGQLWSNSSMLHFEQYSGKLSGPLTVPSNSPYQRRKDLVNPTQFLLSLQRYHSSIR